MKTLFSFLVGLMLGCVLTAAVTVPNRFTVVYHNDALVRYNHWTGETWVFTAGQPYWRRLADLPR
jgi:hypothetical protein